MPLQAVPIKIHDQPFSGYPMNKQEVYTSRMKRPNPLLEPSSYPQVMGKQLPKYEGLLTPQPIEIVLKGRLPSYDVDKAIEKGRLPSYDVDKAIEKYPFTMDIPSIEELQEKKRRLFKKIPEDAVFRKHKPKQVELDRFIDALKEKVIHDYNIIIHVKALRAEYKRSPYGLYSVQNQICKRTERKTNIGVMCTRKVYTNNFVPIPCTNVGRTSWYCNNVPYGKKEILLSYNDASNQAICSKLL